MICPSPGSRVSLATGKTSEMDPKLKSKFESNPLAQRILREGLAIQDRFSAAPVYGPTGKGSLKSAGVTEIADAKKSSRKASGTKK